MSAIEAGWAIKYGSKVDLSEQQLVDCGKLDSSTGKVEDGCEGGWMPSAFNFLAKNGGAVEEYLYSYTGVFGRCASGKPAKVRVEKCIRITDDEDSIKNAIMEYGSLAIAVDADEWYTYGKGIFHAQNPGDINHAVNLIGWGPDYWTIRNSWGSDWGEEGCIRVAKTPDGTYHSEFTFAVKLAY